MDRKKISIIVLVVLVYLLSTGGSYLFFSQAAPVKKAQKVAVPKTATGELQFDESLPKTESCPLNGAKYSKQQRQWWEEHGPLGVMIENHEEARPQSGISKADVVYEAVAEGGISRFLAIFYCQDGGQVGPVRSARTYFIDFASEYGKFPLYAHVGGANTPGPADALGQLEDYGWAGLNDINQFSVGFPTFWRDYDRLGRTVATEHTMYSTTAKLWEFAEKKRDLTNVDEEGTAWDEGFVPYTFKDDAAQAERGTVGSIHLELWEGYKQYGIDWRYDKVTNSYKRSNGGKPHLDKNTNKEVVAKNIIVLVMQESNANDGYENNAHLLYKTKGTGKAYVFMDGKRINGTWKKDGRTARTLISDSAGTAIKLNRGLLWFEILPTDGVVETK